MAISGGLPTVAKTIRVLRASLENASRTIRDRLVTAAEAQARTEAAYARLINRPVNRLEAIKQAQRATRNYTTTRPLATNTTSTAAPRVVHPISRTSTAISKSTARTPFTSTLRPNLTGGALPRTQSGYANGAGRARYFSHAPAPASEVITNVTQAVRAFWQAGQKARFDGYYERTGGKRFRAVSGLQEQARHTLDMSSRTAAGSYIDFKVSPTITAVGPLSSVPRDASFSATTVEDECEDTLASEATMTTLATDFARALKSLAAVMNDLKNLSKLGALPLTLIDQNTLRVRFPGCDRDMVERLCLEVGVKRGMVGEDEDFHSHVGGDVALLFPFAPSAGASEAGFEARPVKRARKNRRDGIDWTHMLSNGTQSVTDPAEFFQFEKIAKHEKENFDPVAYMTSEGEIVDNPWLSSPEGYSSLHPSEDGQLECEETFFAPRHSQYDMRQAEVEASQFEGLEGIYRFIEECDRARR